MDHELRSELQNRLEAEAQALERRIAGLEETTRPIAPDCAIGRLPRAEAVAHQAVFRTELARARGRLREVQVALARLGGSGFGRCAACGEAIAPERLRARPETAHCRRCAERNGGSKP